MASEPKATWLFLTFPTCASVRGFGLSRIWLHENGRFARSLGTSFWEALRIVHFYAHASA